jgi:hypothetical protein
MLSGAVVPDRQPAESRHKLSRDSFVPAGAGKAARDDRPTESSQKPPGNIFTASMQEKETDRRLVSKALPA